MSLKMNGFLSIIDGITKSLTPHLGTARQHWTECALKKLIKLNTVHIPNYSLNKAQKCSIHWGESFDRSPSYLSSKIEPKNELLLSSK